MQQVCWARGGTSARAAARCCGRAVASRRACSSGRCASRSSMIVRMCNAWDSVTLCVHSWCCGLQCRVLVRAARMGDARMGSA
eukprot:3597141-Prymnesium_polylepis.1